MDKFDYFVAENKETERLVFEQEFSHHKLDRDACGEYFFRYVQHAWEGWLSCAFRKSENR